MDPNDQAILTNWYNSLISSGSLNWNLATDLCGQRDIICDTSTPRRVVQLYFFKFFFILFAINICLPFLFSPLFSSF